MNIIVCIKQVPDAAKVEIDPESGSLIREGVDSKINIYDLYALEAALSIREQTGGTITTVCMGPNQATDAVRETLMLGADDGVLISDRAFAGSDVLATSYTLSQAIRVLLAPQTFDLIICGKQTSDGDTAQVGPALAEYLNIPHAAWITEISAANSDGLKLTQDFTDYELKIFMPYPCLITVEKGSVVPRLPSYQRKRVFAAHEIRTLTLAELIDGDSMHYGQNGSATNVERIFPPVSNTDQIIWDSEPELMADKLYDLLVERRFLEVN